MSKRLYKQPTNEIPLPTGAVTLPLTRPIAAYYRQSTLAQVGNISTSMQTIDLPALLQQMGWQRELIILVDMDEGMSGALKIDERDGMKYLFQLIVEGKVGAVACQDEDRLFRDITQIQVNIFIEACRNAHILVLTPTMVYDFAHETMGVFHARQFRFKAEMAAEYLTTVIRGKLHRARNRLLLEGRWAGQATPVGFMIDVRKTLADGSKNENWRRYVPFEKYSAVVAEYFRLFLSHGGALRTTLRHIHKYGPWFPDPHNCKPPEGFRVSYTHMRQFGGGYAPSRPGLINILTNIAYIGHWTFQNAVVRWNNHSPIVPENLFMQAFNYLSPTLFDGLPNPDYRPFVEHARPSRADTRPAELPLCTGMIVTYHNGRWQNVGAHWVKALNRYAYMFRDSEDIPEYAWSKTADFLDEAIVKSLREKLTVTFDASVWAKTLAIFAETNEVEKRRVEGQIQALEQVMENQVASLGSVTTPDLVLAVQKRYNEAKTELARLMTELTRVKNESHQLQVVQALKESCGAALENWNNLKRDEKRVILHSFIETIEVAADPKTGKHITVRWRDTNSETVTLPRQGRQGTQWQSAETEYLLKLLDAQSSQVEIAAAFPGRRWSTIRYKIWSLRGDGWAPQGDKRINERESYNEYLKRVAEPVLEPVTSDAGSPPQSLLRPAATRQPISSRPVP